MKCRKFCVEDSSKKHNTKRKPGGALNIHIFVIWFS
jgi:hypothetical protein